MITVKSNGKFSIPKGEGFIGYAGDNLKVKKEIFVEGIMDMSLIYRVYLKFDDGTCNYFLVDSEVVEGGTKISWTITNDQIYKSGIVQIQLKASNGSGEVFHSDTTTMIVQTSIEFSDYFKEKENSEYLQHQEYLNSLINSHKEATENLEVSIEKSEESIKKSQEALSQAQAVLETAQSNMEKAQEFVTEAESALEEDKEEAQQTLQEAQAKIDEFLATSVDTTPKSGSENLITSGAVYTATNGKMKVVTYNLLTHIELLNSFCSKESVYHMTVAGGLIEGIDENIKGIVHNTDDSQILFLVDGRVFIRHKTNDTWGDFSSVSLSAADLDNLIEMYSLNYNLIYQNLQEEQTLDSLKNYKGTGIVYYFVLAAGELNNEDAVVGSAYINNNTQIIKLLNGAEYYREFVHKGTSTTWSELKQVAFTPEEITANLMEQGSGDLTADTTMALSATYDYCKIGNMVTVNLNIKVTTPTDSSTSAQFSGLPYPVINSGNLNRTEYKMCLSVGTNTYRVIARNDTVIVTQISPANHTPVSLTVDDTLTVSFTYFTE